MEEEVVFACTKCRVVYMVTLLDWPDAVDPPKPDFCPYCKRPVISAEDPTNIPLPVRRPLKLVP